MDANEIFKQMTSTNRFKQIVGQKNIPPEAYEGTNSLVDIPSDYPFIQSLKDIARDFDISNAERTYQILSKTLLNN